MYMGNQKNPMAALEKRIPRNPKYANVQGTLNTGPTAANVKMISTKEFLKRQNEIFERFKARELAEILEREIDRSYENDALLLDLRNVEDYRECRIQTAVSYPLCNIHQDRFTTEMYKYKNKDGKFIILYDDDEKIASEGAKLLTERGFDNIRLLTGGLTIFGNFLPQMLIGNLPQHLVREKPTSPTESVAIRREKRRERQMMRDSPRDFSSSASGFSTSSTVSHRSSFSRAPRWKDDRSSSYRHKEILAKLHHTTTN